MIPVDESVATTFTVNAVNLEENGGRVPVSYRMPPEFAARYCSATPRFFSKTSSP